MMRNVAYISYVSNDLFIEIPRVTKSQSYASNMTH